MCSCVYEICVHVWLELVEVHVVFVPLSVYIIWCVVRLMEWRSLSSCPSIVSVSKDHYYVNNKPFHLCRSQRCRQISVSSYSYAADNDGNSKTTSTKRSATAGRNYRAHRHIAAHSIQSNLTNQQAALSFSLHLTWAHSHSGSLSMFPTDRASHFRGLPLDTRVCCARGGSQRYTTCFRSLVGCARGAATFVQRATTT